jgi:hypothetical protein
LNSIIPAESQLFIPKEIPYLFHHLDIMILFAQNQLGDGGIPFLNTWFHMSPANDLVKQNLRSLNPL